MSSSYTTNNALAKPATGDTNWGATLNGDLDQLDVLGAIGPLAVAPHEVPSASLNVRVAAGSFRKADGTVVSYAGAASQAMTASATNYVYLTDAGVLTVVTTGFPAATSIVRLAVVTAGASTIAAIADARIPWISFGGTPPFLASGGGTVTGAVTISAGGLTVSAGGITVSAGTVSWADAVNLALGTGTGSKIGTAAAQKLGFWGVTPIAQPSGAAQAALTNSTGGTAGSSLAAVGATNSGDVSATINNNFASAWTLLDAIRTALVAAGLIKGSA
jgi:hypothetical protein